MTIHWERGAREESNVNNIYYYCLFQKSDSSTLPVGGSGGFVSDPGALISRVFTCQRELFQWFPLGLVLTHHSKQHWHHISAQRRQSKSTTDRCNMKPAWRHTFMRNSGDSFCCQGTCVSPRECKQISGTEVSLLFSSYLRWKTVLLFQIPKIY